MSPQLYMRFIGNGPGAGNRSSGFDPEGGKRWLAQWLANRRPQLIENAGGVSAGNRAASDQYKNLFSVPVYPSVPAMNDLHTKNYIDPLEIEAEYGKGHSADAARFFASRQRKVLDAANDVMSNPDASGTYITDNIGHRLAVATPGAPEGHQSVLVHELTHSMEADPQEKRISEIMGDANISGGPHSYLEHPSEIYSRLMQIRHDLKLDPNKKYTLDDVKEIKGREGEKYMILDRYDDETILRLLNEVASVNNMDNSIRNS